MLFPLAIAITPRKLRKILRVYPIDMDSPLSNILVKVTRIELKPTIAMAGPVTPSSMALNSNISANTPKRATAPFKIIYYAVSFWK